MRPRAPIDTPRYLIPLDENDDLTVSRARIVLDEAIDEIELPPGTPEDTVKIIKLRDSF